MDYMIEDLMEQLVEMGGSDMHIQAGAPVYFRVSGKLGPINDRSEERRAPTTRSRRRRRPRGV